MFYLCIIKNTKTMAKEIIRAESTQYIADDGDTVTIRKVGGTTIVEIKPKGGVHR